VTAAMPDVDFSVVQVAACNLSSVGAPSTLSKAIRGLHTISTLLKDEIITEVEAEFPGGQGPNYRELGEWGRLPCQSVLHVVENKFTNLQKILLLLLSHQFLKF